MFTVANLTANITSEANLTSNVTLSEIKTLNNATAALEMNATGANLVNSTSNSTKAALNSNSTKFEVTFVDQEAEDDADDEQEAPKTPQALTQSNLSKTEQI